MIRQAWIDTLTDLALGTGGFNLQIARTYMFSNPNTITTAFASRLSLMGHSVWSLRDILYCRSGYHQLRGRTEAGLNQREVHLHGNGSRYKYRHRSRRLPHWPTCGRRASWERRKEGDSHFYLTFYHLEIKTFWICSSCCCCFCCSWMFSVMQTCNQHLRARARGAWCSLPAVGSK